MQRSTDTMAIWQLDLMRMSAHRAECVRVLSAVELGRSERYKIDAPRETFILTRGALRYILASYLNTAPQTVPIVEYPSQKPVLAAPYNAIHFNVSHTQGLALIAVAREVALGVDIEAIKPLDDLSIARRYFSDADRQQLQHAPAEKQLEAFYQVWTRKEAYIKGRGEGLAYPLDGFDVQPGNVNGNLLLADRHDPGALDVWHIQNITISKTYAAALAVENPSGLPVVMCSDLDIFD